MYVRRLTITQIRSIDNFEFRVTATEAPGWHVILGPNGAGKSSVIRSLALALAGPREAVALRQNWSTWVRNGAPKASIALQVDCGTQDVFTGTGRRAPRVDAELCLQAVETTIGSPRFEVAATSGNKAAERTIWGTNAGWFSASFGPFRRFTGGDQQFDRLFFSNPRLASHLSAFGEDVALTEGLRWLRDLHVKQLENSSTDGDLLKQLVAFLNDSALLPHGAKIAEVRADEVLMFDGGGARVAVEQLSDGYRSVLSMIFEILRQMTRSYGPSEVIDALKKQSGSVVLPGVVAIDEVDAHLHPSWQRDIGPWFTRCFPEVQFIVTTHSPIVCRAATSVWRLTAPGTDERPGRVEGDELNRLTYGSILDAYGTELFGRDIARSQDSRDLLQELASLNRKALKGSVTDKERSRMEELRRTLPTRAMDTAAE